MAIIGQFTRTPTGFAGRLRTIVLDDEFVFVPTEGGDAKDAPVYRIRLGDEDGPEAGAVWKAKTGTDLSVVLDDPSFAQPIRARMFQTDEEGRSWAVRWIRPKKQDKQDEQD